MNKKERVRQIGFKVSAAEHEEIRQQAQKCGLSMGAYIRSVLLYRKEVNERVQ